MKKTIKYFEKFAIGLLMFTLVSIGSVITAPQTVLADVAPNACEDGQIIMTIFYGARCVKPTDGPENLFGVDGIFTKITNTALFLIGALSVIMLIYGGIRYTVSGGDATAVTNAKNTILYAIVGIIVAVLAFALVQFVIGQLVTTPAGTT